MAKDKDKSKTICVISTKGGIGKSIFTINMAGIYASIKKKVLIIDLDLTCGSIAMALNKPYDKSVYDLIEDIKTNSFNKISDYSLKYNDYIECLACPKDPRQASLIDVNYLSTLLEYASYEYDMVLIDTNHNLSSVNLYIMDKVDELLFLISNDPLNLKSTRSLIAILDKLEISNYRVVLNNSFNPYKSYFSLFDVKNIIKHNIDYTISPEFFIPNIDKMIMDGQIITLQSSTPRVFNKDYTSMVTLATEIMKRG